MNTLKKLALRGLGEALADPLESSVALWGPIEGTLGFLGLGETWGLFSNPCWPLGEPMGILSGAFGRLVGTRFVP